VGQAFSALGINIPSLIAFILNFFIIYALLGSLLWKPIRKTLDARRQRIQDALSAADRAAEQARDAEARVQEQIRQAQLQGQEIVANAQQVAQRIQDEAQRDAQVRGQQIIERAQATIAQETEAARVALRREFADLTILAAERVINQSLDRPAHERLINEVLTQSSIGRN
jgi:F-type H+-transporting ATPase subunit b